ncbi:MAG: septum formation protein Maf [Bacteroidetes bacterium]|nr:MAG: septum formation protein Maf [Bacteroidota bacterium]
MEVLNQKLVLVSKSPRRSQLLREAGFRFEVRTAEVDEVWPDDLPAEEVATYLARVKAEGSRHLLRPGEILLTADSVVILGGEVLGKPADRDEAIAMLERLSGNRHTVITGVCLLSQNRERVFAGRTEVWFWPMERDEIEWYVDRYRPYDKAGSYGVQEWIGLCRVRKIEGTYANVMGLPVDLVYEELKQFVGAT